MVVSRTKAGNQDEVINVIKVECIFVLCMKTTRRSAGTVQFIYANDKTSVFALFLLISDISRCSFSRQWLAQQDVYCLPFRQFCCVDASCAHEYSCTPPPPLQVYYAAYQTSCFHKHVSAHWLTCGRGCPLTMHCSTSVSPSLMV